MERKENVMERKFSVLKGRKHFSNASFKSDDFMLKPLSDANAADFSQVSGYVIGIVYSGIVKTKVAGKALMFRSNSIFFFNKDTSVESFKVSKACKGYIINFSDSFIDNVIVNVKDHMSVFMRLGREVGFPIAETDAYRLQGLAAMLSEAIETEQYAYNEKVITSLFTACFYMLVSIVDSYTQEQPQEFGSRSRELLQQFTQMLGQECGSERSVEYYARRLNITPKYLSIICRKHMNRNASKVIDEAVVRKAKQMLMQSGLSIAEVAEKLNFVSQSFFGKYFKQRVGMSPSRYKAQIF